MSREADELAAIRLRRQWIWAGRILSPVVAVLVYVSLRTARLADGSALPESARATAACGALMAGLWVTEALPLPATALLPLVLFPLFGILPVREAAAPYASPPIFLFMGGFMVALAMEKWGLHRRIALHIVYSFGRSVTGILIGFVAATAILSMWLSNTATTVMMVPIAMAVVRWSQDKLSPEQAASLGESMMLSIAYAASIGGTMTLIGTPPNVLLAAFVREELHGELGFVDWLGFAVPLGVAMLSVLCLYMSWRLPRGIGKVVSQTRESVGQALRDLGPLQRGERIVLVVFLGMVVALVGGGLIRHKPEIVARFPVIGALTDEVVVLLAALVLFALPVDLARNEFALDWQTAERLPWGVLLIFGGGLSLARAVSATGFDEWIAHAVTSWHVLPPILFVAAVTAVVVFATELASNTATASAFLPILAAAAKGVGVPPSLLLVPATVAASFAFMLPSGTPPNAIVFGTGMVSIQRMARVGLFMNVVAILLITLAVQIGVPGF